MIYWIATGVPTQLTGTIHFYIWRGVSPYLHCEFLFTPQRHTRDAGLATVGSVKIEKGKRVRAKVKLQVVGGDVIEQSVVEYFQGAGTMLVGLEKALDGAEPGAQLEGVLKPTDAFGNPATQLSKTVPRSEFPGDAKLEVGAEFAAKAENGQAIILVVQSVSDKAVEVKLMHSLAKKEIQYQVEVLSVTDPTPPPLPGGAILKDEETGEFEKVSDKN